MRFVCGLCGAETSTSSRVIGIGSILYEPRSISEFIVCKLLLATAADTAALRRQHQQQSHSVAVSITLLEMVFQHNAFTNNLGHASKLTELHNCQQVTSALFPFRGL